MPFIRQTRDKRGFEYTYVMHTYHPGAGGQHRPRLLYLFRSPASVKLGRSALDAEVMEALEHTHPDLSFDWQSLTRDAAATRVDNSQDRDRQQQNQQQRRPGQNQPRAGRPRESGPGNGGPPSPEVLPPDNTVLGRVVGAGEATRMRRRYSELLQRIARRARTPEERERLTERLNRLNPDDWTDEAMVRANAPGADAGWNAIGAELPSRRRGRRGGRGRSEAPPGPSAIMNVNPAEARTGEGGPETGDEGPEETDIPGPGDVGGGDGAVGSVAADPDPEA